MSIYLVTIIILFILYASQVVATEQRNGGAPFITVNEVDQIVPVPSNAPESNVIRCTTSTID